MRKADKIIHQYKVLHIWYQYVNYSTENQQANGIELT